MTINQGRGRFGVAWYVAPAVVYVLALFWVGSIHTGIDIPQDLIARDKANHFVAFGLLALLCLRAFRYQWAGAGFARLVALSVVTASVLGALLEFWQLLFPYRSSDVWDWVADTLGAIVAGIGIYSWSWWRRRFMAARERSA